MSRRRDEDYDTWKRPPISEGRRDDAWVHTHQRELDAVDAQGAQNAGTHRLDGARERRQTDAHRGPDRAGFTAGQRGHDASAYAGYDHHGTLDESGYAEHGRHAPQTGGDRLPSQRGGEVASHRGRGPRGWTRSDLRIEEDIHQVLTDDPELDASDISLSVQDGIATLQGDVEHRWQKRHAEALVASCRGVRDVHNCLRSRDRATQAPEDTSPDDGFGANSTDRAGARRPTS